MSSTPGDSDSNGPKDKTDEDEAAAEVEDEQEEWSDAETVQMPAISEEDTRSGD